MSNNNRVGLLITMPEGEKARAPDHMVFPEWLTAPEGISSKLFDSVETAKECYTRYYIEINKGTQQNLSAALQRLIVYAMKSFADKDTSDLAVLGQQRDAVMQGYADWRATHNRIFDQLGIRDLFFYVDVVPGEELKLRASPVLQELSEGLIQKNFLSTMEPTMAERAFTIGIVQKSMLPEVPLSGPGPSANAPQNEPEKAHVAA